MLQFDTVEATMVSAFAEGARTRMCEGEVVSVDTDGAVWVRVPAGGNEPLRANVLDHVSRDGLETSTVLLVFLDSDMDRPLVLGRICPRLAHPAPTTAPERLSSHGTTNLGTTKLEGRRIVLEASEEIELKTGNSALTLRKDGKVVTKGRHLVSRALMTVRIKGASVAIN